MSRLLAKTLSRAMTVSGRRSEIVRSDGLRLGRNTRWAWVQSTYKLESCLVQKALSARSDLNFGIAFFFVFLMSLVDPEFVSIRVSGRNHADEFSPNGESYKQPAASASLPQRVLPDFATRARLVLPDYQRLVEE